MFLKLDLRSSISSVSNSFDNSMIELQLAYTKNSISDISTIETGSLSNSFGDSVIESGVSAEVKLKTMNKARDNSPRSLPHKITNWEVRTARQ